MITTIRTGIRIAASVCVLALAATCDSIAQEANDPAHLQGDIDLQESGGIEESIDASQNLANSAGSALSAEVDRDVGYVRKKPAEPQFFAPNTPLPSGASSAPEGRSDPVDPQPTLDDSLDSIEKDVEKLDQERSELGQ